MADDPTADALPDPGPEPEDADLVAYLDGELDPDDAREVEDRLTADPDTRDRAQALKKTYDLLDYLPRPEPSPNFTARTLTRLQPTASASGLVLPGPTRRGWVEPVIWLALAVAAAGGGYLAHAGLRPFVDPPPKAEELALSDLRVIERLPLYIGVDDLDFARRLDDPDLFAPDPSGPTPAPAGVKPDLAGPNRDRLIALFKSYPPARQQQLRRLDQQFHDLPPAERDRLDRVLEAYAVWLDRLPDADRRQVLAAPTPDDRLSEVRRVREKVRQDGLSQARKDLLKVLVDVEKRARQLDEWQQADRTRRAEWVVARRQWDLLQRGEHKLWPFTDADLARQVDDWITGVLKVDLAKPEPRWNEPHPVRVTREEYHDLKARREAALQDGHWGLYGLLLYRLSESHPGLPEPPGRPPLTDFGQQPLPPEVIRELRKRPGPLRFRGKWPEFAREVAAAAERARVTLAEPLGPARPGAFAGPVNEFLDDLIGRDLTWKERVELSAFEGRWPEYPERLIELARRHDRPVPGVTLPGSPKRWRELYSLDGLKGTE